MLQHAQGAKTLDHISIDIHKPLPLELLGPTANRDGLLKMLPQIILDIQLMYGVRVE